LPSAQPQQASAPPGHNLPTETAQATANSAEAPDALNPAERVFVVAANLDITAPASGQECSLTAGDVVMRLSDTPDGNQNVTASIQSSKQGDCVTGQTVAIGVQDLQEMHNQFREQLDSGLKTLADKGGIGGLPKPPDTATTVGEVPPPTPDAGAADQLEALQVQADQTEYEVAEQVQNSGDLKTALALFQVLAEKPGCVQAQAQVSAQQVTRLIADANSSGCCVSGTVARPGRGVGILNGRPYPAAHTADTPRAGQAMRSTRASALMRARRTGSLPANSLRSKPAPSKPAAPPTPPRAPVPK
jgi:hypothetical protein